MKLALLAALLSVGGTPLVAVAQDVERKALRVCQDPSNMPFSNTKGEGYENKIAELFGKELSLPVEYYSFPQRLAFIRNTLRYKLPGENYPCDIVIGVPAGFDQVSVTKPYYRSTYALVFPAGKGLDSVKTGQDFAALAADKKLRIGLYDRSPASEWLKYHNLVDLGVPYQMMSANPEQYPGEIIEKDLVEGKIDAAIVWGPIAGYFGKKVTAAPLTVVPLKSERHVKFDYEMAMGVRYGEKEWKDQVEKLIEANKPKITAILKEYGVPLVDANGELIR